MDTEDIARSVLGNLGLLGATLGVIAVIRRGIPTSGKGTCQSCGGRGFKECTLCYGKGYLSTPGYVNFADPRQRRICQRCGGSKTVDCTACGSAAMGVRKRPGSMQDQVDPMRRPANPASRIKREKQSDQSLNKSRRRRQRHAPLEEQDDEF